MMDSDKISAGRRSFLKLSGLVGFGSLAAFLLPAESADAFLFNKKEYKVTKTRLSMGTFVAMTAIHPSKDQAEEAFGLAFDEVYRLSALLSRHSPSSPVSSLNNTGLLEDSPAEVQDVVERSLYFNVETGGSFDISVKPLLDLYQDSFESGVSPDEDQIQRAVDLIGSRHILIQGRTIALAHENMEITLDGIAKGYIVDRASEILRKNGIDNHLINAGGDIRTSGTAAKGKQWTVAIQDPNKKGAYPDIIKLSDGAIATSGNYEVFYDQEKIFHHIVNPFTGLSPQLSASVSITAPTVMDADALSTAVFVLEPDSGIKFINSRPDCECFVIDRGGKSYASTRWGS
jgi:thiamine biosynthesis lipoprotein